jgi:hypothetical protein
LPCQQKASVEHFLDIGKVIAVVGDVQCTFAIVP